MHSYVRELKDLYKKGKVTRREFLYYSTLLGLSYGAATAFLAACGAQPTATPTTVSLPATPTKPAAQPTTAPAVTTPSGPAPTATTAPMGTPTAAAAVKRGGSLKWAERVMRIDVPWRVEWMQQASAMRQVTEHLTYPDEQNISRPRLAEKWDASEDLLTWTFHIRKGVKFNNGKELTAEDAAYSVQQMTKKDVSPSMSGYLNYAKPENIKATDKYTLTLHADRPEIAVAEHFSYGTAFILPKDWSGDWTKDPVGTGPFQLVEYVPAERVKYKRREDYWGMGADGKPLPYLDEMVITDYGEEAAARVAALSSGQTEYIQDVDIATLPSIKNLPNAKVVELRTARTSVMRLRRDRTPFTDKGVRNALKAVQNRKQLLDTAFLGMGDLGYDHHVSPIQPEFCPEEVPKQDITKAKALLAEAGFPNGIDVTFTVKNDPQWEGRMAEVYKEQAAQAGIRVKIEVVPSSVFWDNWDKYDLAAVEWMGRPLAIMMMNIAYRCGVPWNETRMCEPEFDKMLDEASGTLDVEKRRQIFCKIQAYHRENGGVLNPFFTNQFRAANKRVNGFLTSPMNYVDHVGTWLA